MKVTLLTPIEVDKTTYAEFTFREAETGDLMAADSFPGQTSKIAAILASMAEVPIAVFRKVKAKDFNRIMKEVGHLMGEQKPGQTGGSS